MKSAWLFVLAAPALLLDPAPARAQDPPGCPPGEWFCDEPSSGSEPASSPDDAPPEEDPEAAPPLDADPYGGLPPSGSERDIRLRAPAASAPSDSGWSEGSGGRQVVPWAVAMRLEGVLLDGKRGEDAALGGLGVSGRYTVNPVVTLDLGFDSIAGTDYNGYDRTEFSLSFSSLFFLNYHPVLRTYVLIGLNTSRARVDVPGGNQTWGYLGAHTGLGLDIALDSRISLNVDVLAFMRGRTDSRAAREPEFTDDGGRVTNTSGGGLLRGGVVLRF